MRLMLVCVALCVCPIQTSEDHPKSQEAHPQAAAPAEPVRLASASYQSVDFAVSSLFEAESFAQNGFTESETTADSWVPDVADDRPVRVFSKRELCQTAVSVAEANNLPALFFANLIQQESGFQPNVVSRAGAQGIAQFMPRVAAENGVDPFDPIPALHASGKFLSRLRAQFGNLGLAAAAYNAGSRRVQDWMARRGKLPAETRHYVRTITGQPAEHWARRRSVVTQARMPLHARCEELRAIAAEAAAARAEGAGHPASAAAPSRKRLAFKFKPARKHAAADTPKPARLASR